MACFANKACKTESYHPNHLFSSVNLLASRPHDVKLCLHLIYFMLTSTPSTAKCEPGFSAMNHLECNLRTTLVKNALPDLMQCANAPFRQCNEGLQTKLSYHLLVFWSKDKQTHSDIQINYRHSQTVSKFVDDVHSRNLIHVSSTKKELKYFL